MYVVRECGANVEILCCNLEHGPTLGLMKSAIECWTQVASNILEVFCIDDHQVHLIHDLAWAGTPHEGAAWLRLQKLIDIWHRIMLIPVVGGVVVGLMHAIVALIDQVKASRPVRRQSIDWLAGTKPALKATQAMVTLGTGCSLGPEGPSVDIGKAWAHGLATVMKNNRERRIALVAAGAAAGISAGTFMHEERPNFLQHVAQS